MRRPSRRDFLRGLTGATAALPFLECLRPGRALAGPSHDAPKRFVVVHNYQGTVMNRWLPSGTETSFTLNDITSPLVPFQDRIVAVAGLDNRIPDYNSAGSGHDNADLTLLTCQPFHDQSASVLSAGGPSIDQVLAERLSGSAPYPRLDFAIGGGSGTGQVTASHFWAGPNDPISAVSSPLIAFNRLFGDADLSEAELSAQRTRRGAVLDRVLGNFDSLKARVGADDRARLEAHAAKVSELATRVTREGAACVAPAISLPGGYEYSTDDNVSAPVMIDLLTMALSCGMTRVATLHFAQGHSPTFPWLDVDGGPVVPTGQYDNWHGMVHDGRDEEGLVVGFTWYQQMFADLLAAMDASIDEDGDNLLDTSCVLWISEFGNGSGHNTLKIPVVIAGCLGRDAPMGRFVDVMNGGADDNYVASDFSTNQLMVSLLNAFGQGDTSFGLVDGGVPNGPLPGLLG